MYSTRWKNISCYTKKGLDDTSYIASVYLEAKFKDVDTTAPGLETFYIRTREDGSLYIDNVYGQFNSQMEEYETDAEVSALLDAFSQQEMCIRDRLYNDLRQKGISTDVITRSLEEEFFSDERQQIMDLIEKKGFSADTADQKEYRKMYQFLMRRGFKGADIMAVMRYSSQAYCEL